MDTALPGNGKVQVKVNITYFRVCTTHTVRIHNTSKYQHFLALELALIILSLTNIQMAIKLWGISRTRVGKPLKPC